MKRLDLEKKVQDLSHSIEGQNNTIILQQGKIEEIEKKEKFLIEQHDLKTTEYSAKKKSLEELSVQFNSSILEKEKEFYQIQLLIKNSNELIKNLEDETAQNTDLLNLANNELLLTTLTKEIDKEKTSTDTLSSSIKIKEENISYIKQGLEIKLLMDGGKCPTCGQPTYNLHTTYEDKYHILKVDASKVKVDLLEAEKNLENERKTLLEAQRRLAIVESEKKDVLESTGVHDVLQPVVFYLEKIEQLKKDLFTEKEKEEAFRFKFNKQQLEIAGLQAKKSSVEEELLKLVPPTEDQLNESKQELLNQKTSCKEEIKRSNAIIASIETSKKEVLKNIEGLPPIKDIDKTLLDSLNAQYKEVEEKINEYNEISISNNQILINNNKIIENQKENDLQIIEITNDLKTLGDNLIAYKEAKSILEKDLPNYLIVKTCARLEELINDFVHTIFPDMIIELKQNKRGVNFYYTPAITGKVDDKKIKKLPCKMASGMESATLSLAWRWALSQAYGLNILLCDEIDASSDNSDSLKLFTKLFQDPQFDQILVITHKTEVREELMRAFDASAYRMIKGKAHSID
jgi:DNA repair exonuclease SbcCD ATPase subunit